MDSGTSAYIALEAIQVATPCRADWNAMRGDDRARFCQNCAKHVYNLADMTREDAERLIRSHEGELCIRLSRRADGTVVTDDCPVGIRSLRNASRYTGRIALQPVRWTFFKTVMLLAPLMLVGTTMWAKSERRQSCPSFTQVIERTWLYHMIVGRKVQTVFGMSTKALTTGDMLNLPAIDMLSSEESAREKRAHSEGVPPESPSQPAGL